MTNTTNTTDLRASLIEARDWFESQAKAVSKGCGSSYELHDLRVQRDALDAALAAPAQDDDSLTAAYMAEAHDAKEAARAATPCAPAIEDEIRKQDEALIRLMLEALECSGEPDDPGHRCSHCDDYVDRNSVLRNAARKRLEAVGAGGVEPLRKRECLHQISEPAQPVGAAPVGIVAASPGYVGVGWIGGYVPKHNDKLYAAHQPAAQPKSVDENDSECEAPPIGWRCTRTRGHDGPCAAAPSPEDRDFVERGMRRIRDAVDAERYRCLRSIRHWIIVDGRGYELRDDGLDSAIDDAIAAQKGNHD